MTRMTRTNTTRRAVILLTSLLLATSATAEWSIDGSVIPGGVGSMSGGDWSAVGTIGEAATGMTAGGDWESTGGADVLPPDAAPCPADLDASGDVGFGDLLQVLSGWGGCDATCPLDLDDSGDIGFGDLLVVLSAWGPCP